MDEKQLQFLFNEYAKGKGFKDFSEFKGLMESEPNRKMFFDESNKELGFKDYNEFNNLLGLKKKVSGEISSLTELPSEFIEPLKKGISPQQPASKKKTVAPTLIIPTNLPKQEAAKYERELKVQDAAINTLKNVYKQKGLNFNESSPAGQKQIQDYVNKAKNNDLVVVTGKDQKNYMTRGEGALETFVNSLTKSFKEPVESFEINQVSNASDLADMLDEKMKQQPNVPESAPSGTSGYLMNLLGGLPKMSAELAIPYAGEAVMVGEMYHNAIANQRMALYQKGLSEGKSRLDAAQAAMNAAPVTAIPDAVMGAFLARGTGAQANIIKEGAKNAFKEAATNFVKTVPKVAVAGGIAEGGRALAEKQAGYNVDATDAVNRMFESAGEWGIMDAAFKVMNGARYLPKALYSAAKNVLTEVPKPILEMEASKYPNKEELIQNIENFAQTKSKVADLVPEEKAASVTGLTEKLDKINTEIKDLEEKKKEVPASLGVELDSQISEKSKEANFYNKQIEKVINSKDITGIKEEVDDVTGVKLGETPKIEPRDFSKMSIEELEKRQTEIEDSKSGTPEYKEYNDIDKELQNREWRSVFDAPLDKVSQVIDDIMKKEKEMPYGYGSYMEPKDARLSKEIIEKYSKENVSSLSDNEIVKDFKDAMFGNPSTWYADGLKLRESLKEAQNRGIDVFDKYTQEFIKDGYTKEEAVIAANRALEPILKSIQKQPLIEEKVTEKVPFISSQKHTVELENGNLIVKDKSGNVLSDRASKKALEEYADKFDYSKGERIESVPPEIQNEREALRYVIENTKNPLEVTEVYSKEEPMPFESDAKMQAIAENGLGRIKTSSYERFGDPNKIEKSMYLNIFSEQRGVTIDQLAKSISDRFDIKIEPQDIVEYIEKYSRGDKKALQLQETDIQRMAKDKFKELTGLDLTPELANKIFDKELEKANQDQLDIIKQDYETAQQLEDAYWKAYAETDGFTKESPVSKADEAKSTEKSLEQAYKDLTRNEKRRIINSKFEELVKELKIEKICP